MTTTPNIDQGQGDDIGIAVYVMMLLFCAPCLYYLGYFAWRGVRWRVRRLWYSIRYRRYRTVDVPALAGPRTRRSMRQLVRSIEWSTVRNWAIAVVAVSVFVAWAWSQPSKDTGDCWSEEHGSTFAPVEVTVCPDEDL